LRREHLAVTPPPLTEKIPDVPPAFSEAIDRAILKDRGDRQSTAGELADQLRAGLAGAIAGASSASASLNTPQAQSPYGHTQGSAGAITSNSDVNAATILTVEAVPTSPPNVPPAMRPLAAERPEQQRPAQADGDDVSSVVTVLQVPKPQVAPKKSRGKSLVFAGAGVLLLTLVVVGGFLAVNWLKTRSDDSPTGAAGNGKTGAGSTGTAAAAEFGRYWLEVLPNALAAEPERVAGGAPLASGQAFKFHFEFGENGYVYIIGPGEGNQLTAFLTEKPAAISGLESNAIAKGNDFSFPNGIEHWLELDKKPGTENYTIIFSPKRLSAPGFLSSQTTGKPLSETEQGELTDFLAEHKASAIISEVNNNDAAAPFVMVKVPKSTGGNASGTPVVFEVRIEHK